jgi:hypothetical protein
MREAYIKMQENCGIRVGDKVKVLRKAKDYENGWSVVWAKEMDEYIGEVGEVTSIDYSGILINISDENWYFPFFVLEKVEEEVYYCIGDKFGYSTWDFSETCILFLISHEKVNLFCLKDFNRYIDGGIKIKNPRKIKPSEIEDLISNFKLIEKSPLRDEGN